VRYLVYLLVGAALSMKPELLQIGAVTQRYSNTLFNLVYSGPNYFDRGQGNIAVVLLDEKALQLRKQSWPVDYAFHAEVLQSIWAQQPKAVMLDILFVDQRADASIAQLNDTICQMAQDGIRIYLGSADPTALHAGLRPDLDPRCFTPVGIELVTDEFDHTVRQYPLLHQAKGGASYASPAFAIYRDLYASAFRPDAASNTLELVWGTETSKSNRKWMQCNSPGVFPLILEGITAVKRDCPYHTTFLVADMLSRSNDADIAAGLKDAIVFYGVNLTGNADLIYPPTHTPISGVYWHAMGLDNLIGFGAEYKRQRPSSLLSRAYLVDLFLLMLMLGSYWLYESQQSKLPEAKSWSDKIKHAGLFGLFFVSTAGLLIFVSVQAFLLLPYPPGNVLLFLGFMGVIKGIRKNVGRLRGVRDWLLQHCCRLELEPQEKKP
jgi:CHASE2 domain-containing sensor protein